MLSPMSRRATAKERLAVVQGRPSGRCVLPLTGPCGVSLRFIDGGGEEGLPGHAVQSLRPAALRLKRAEAGPDIRLEFLTAEGAAL